MDETTMVVTVDALEKAGPARRRPSRSDRRARIISVTEQGERAVAEGARVADRVHREVLDALPEDERDVLVRAPSRLAEGPLATPAESERPVRRARRPHAWSRTRDDIHQGWCTTKQSAGCAAVVPPPGEASTAPWT